MEFSEVIKAIVDIGFAPVMCLAIYWVNVKQIQSLEQTINNNTLMIQRLIDKLGVDTNEHN